MQSKFTVGQVVRIRDNNSVGAIQNETLLTNHYMVNDRWYDEKDLIALPEIAIGVRVRILPKQATSCASATVLPNKQATSCASATITQTDAADNKQTESASALNEQSGKIMTVNSIMYNANGNHMLWLSELSCTWPLSHIEIVE